MISNDIKLSQIIAPSFHQVHRDIRDETYNEFWLRGGRGSTKSTFVAEQIILGIINDPTANAIAIRKTANTIRTSVLETLLFAIDMLGVDKYFDHIKSPSEITYLPTGQKIIMRGLDEPSKLKSIKLRKGYFKYLWFEEGEEYSGLEEIRSVKQSVLRGGDKFVEFFTYNPPRNPNHWVNKVQDEINDDRLIHHSNYQEVPRHWLGEKFFADAEKLKINNFEAYQHEYGGIPIGNPEEIIFSGKYEVAKFETPPINDLYMNRLFYGADWGFANDPTVLIRLFIMDNNLYIDKEIYGYQTQIDDLPALFDQIPDSRRWQIKADNSRPETISYLARRGFNIEGASKSSDRSEGETKSSLIIDGIEYIKGFNKVIIHEDCKKVLEEFQNYSYKIDKNTKEVLPVVNDTAGWDHGIDAIRYALVDYIKQNISIWDVL